MAIAIAQAESSRYVDVVNRNPSPPTDDLGLWQINDYYHSNSIGHASGSELYDADRLYNLNLYSVASVKGYNAAAAFQISNSGSTWTQWATFYNFDQVNHYGDANFAGYGAYKSYVGDARYWASLADPVTVLTGPNQNVVAEQGVNVRNNPGGSTTGLRARVAGDKGVVLSGPSALTQVGGTGPWYIWWQIRWSDGEVGWSIENNLSKTTAAGATTIFTIDGNGVPVRSCPIQVDGQSVGSTDQNGRLSLTSLLCGNHRVRAVLGYLFHDAFVSFVCQNANTPTDDQAAFAGTSNNVAQINLDSTASCSSLSPAHGLAVGDVVEVFGTGNGLRARYPNACSDSYAVMPDNSVGTIIGAWQCCSGYVRWKIRYDDLAGIDVWSAEGEPSTGQKFLRKIGGGGTVQLEYSSNVTHDGSGGGVGNNDGKVNPGEEIDLDVILRNRGTAPATNVSATISSSSNYIDITDNDVSFSDIPGGETVTSSSDFDFTVSQSAPSGHVINFTLQIFSDQGSATQSFSVTVVSGETGAVLALSTNSLNIGSGEGGGNILVKNNGAGILNWSASSPASWITVLTQSGTITFQGGEQGLSFSFPENPSTSSRVGTIVVSASGATGSPQTLTVTQAGSGSSTPTPSPIPSATPTATPNDPAQLGNISTRMRVETGDNVMIGGFIISGQEQKRVILRAMGPSLPVSGALRDPTLDLYGAAGLIATNDDWRNSQEQEIFSTGISPSNDLESAIVGYLVPGTYTAVVSGYQGLTGVSVIELYDLELGANAKVANISTRGLVQIGDDVMIGGLIITGSTSANVLIRAIGPSLTKAGVPNALQDPMLELRDGNGALFAANDNWRDSQLAEISGTTISPTDDRESAILRSLAPGAYTAIVRGVGNSTGVALVEVYQLAPSPPTSTPTVATLFQDNFDDNTIDSAKWTIRGNAVGEASGQMQIRTNTTDNGGVLTSQQFSLNGRGPITMTRSVMIHYGNNYAIPTFVLKIGNFAAFHIHYANMSYDGSPHRACYGTTIGATDGNPHSLTGVNFVSAPIPTLWNTWYNEKVVFTPESGNVQYFVNGELKIEYNVGVLPTDVGTAASIEVNAWGWYTGHQHFFDDLVVTQSVTN